jgi:predicted metal-dependent hydrolase
MSDTERVTLNWSSDALADGLACYSAEQFFEAHEYWESVWLTLLEPEKSFLQSLVQVTAAFHHFETGNLTGAVSLLRRALNRLSQCPVVFGGIQVAPFRAEVKEWLEALESVPAARLAAYPKIRPVDARPEL